jgi:hypothetical protein
MAASAWRYKKLSDVRGVLRVMFDNKPGVFELVDSAADWHDTMFLPQRKVYFPSQKEKSTLLSLANFPCFVIVDKLIKCKCGRGMNGHDIMLNAYDQHGDKYITALTDAVRGKRLLHIQGDISVKCSKCGAPISFRVGDWICSVYKYYEL